MPTSLLYHGFGIRGYHHLRTTFERGSVIFKIQPGATRGCAPGTQIDQLLAASRLSLPFYEDTLADELPVAPGEE